MYMRSLGMYPAPGDGHRHPRAESAPGAFFSMHSSEGGAGGRPSGSRTIPRADVGAPADRPVHDREVVPDWKEYPRYCADHRQAGDEAQLVCADCGQTAFELFHGRCTPCAIASSIPLRQKDRDAYETRVRLGMTPQRIRKIPPAPPAKLPRWHWRHWWPWATRRRRID